MWVFNENVQGMLRGKKKTQFEDIKPASVADSDITQILELPDKEFKIAMI